MAEEDDHLKELVIQSLENTGVLAKIRAQLRASVFLALDDAKTLEKKKPLANNELQNYLATRNGQIVACLVREFLQHFNLDSTLSVFDSESYYGQLYSGKDRHSLCQDLGLDVNEAAKGPIVDAVVAKQLVRSNAQESTTKAGQPALATEEPKAAKPSSLDVTPLQATVFASEAEENERDPFFDDPAPGEDAKSLQFGGFFGSRDSGLKQDHGSSGDGGEPSEPKAAATTGFQDSTFTLSPLGFLKDAPPLGSSLKDAPPLVNSKGPSKLPPLWTDNAQAPFRTAMNAKDDDYEEDFQSSASIRSDAKSGTELSIEEDIDENISGAVDDLLSIEGNSEVDDATTDHTISNVSAGGADYLESIG